MAPLTDPQILASLRAVLNNWHVTDYITWKDLARDWVGKNLVDYTPRDVARLMCEHVETGGEIDQVRERRPEWTDRDFHYDFRIRIGDRLLYIETVLVDDD